MGDVISSNNVWGSVLRQHGFKKAIAPDSCPDCFSVRDFTTLNPEGTFVLGADGHVVTVKDGSYFDSWDSGDVPVVYVWYGDVTPTFGI